VGLTLLERGWIGHLHLVELDPRVAAFWKRATEDPDFITEVESFECDEYPSRTNVTALLADESADNMAMWVLVKNRCSFGGRLEKGRLLNYGNGKGLSSRWKRSHLVSTLKRIQALKDSEGRSKVTFEHGDGIKALREARETYPNKSLAAFIDPPYTATTAGGGHEMYQQSVLNHRELFDNLKGWPGPWVATYDDTQFIRDIIRDDHLDARVVKMRNTHHHERIEVVIGKSMDWLPNHMCRLLGDKPSEYREHPTTPTLPFTETVQSLQGIGQPPPETAQPAVSSSSWS
jgi:DNA adenine methylase